MRVAWFSVSYQVKLTGIEQEITARAMNGELDFSASLKARVALLKGVPADVFEKLKSIITIAPGARELCRALKRLGYKTAVLSGGFQPLADWLARELGLDYAFANHVSCFQNIKKMSKNIKKIKIKKDVFRTRFTTGLTIFAPARVR